MIYESDQDRANQEIAVAMLCDRLGCQYASLPKLSSTDYTLFSGNILVGFAEIKCRTNPMALYDTAIIDESKVIYSQKLKEKFGVPSFFVIMWSDYCGFTRLDTGGVFKTIGGRNDRGDPNDGRDLLANFPIKSFTIIGSSKHWIDSKKDRVLVVH